MVEYVRNVGNVGNWPFLVLLLLALPSGHTTYRIIPFHSMCQSYTGIGGEIAGGIVKLDSKPAVIILRPGDKLPRSSCEVTIAANKGEGVAVHIESLNLPRQIHSHCRSWLQLESESESTRGTWVRVKSFSEKICGSFDQEKRKLSGHHGIWNPRYQFYNETASNHITIKFNPGYFNLKKLSFEIVATPLTLNCGMKENDRPTWPSTKFKCGDSGDYCIDASLVCDGKVNCMLPHREAVDESNILCKKNGETPLKNIKNVVNADPGKICTHIYGRTRDVWTRELNDVKFKVSQDNKA